MGNLDHPSSERSIEILHLGLDLGSVSVKLAVVDSDGRVLETVYKRHQGQPVPAAVAELEALLGRYPNVDGQLRRWPGHVAVTGTGGRALAALVGGRFVNEVVCQGTAVHHLRPEVRTLVEMGGEDSKLIILRPGSDGQAEIEDFAMNSVCAAGTGSFLDQQASRLGLTIEQFGELSLRSKAPPRVAGRCSVFAKSDMIHLQQQATPDYDIVAGLCVGLARNFKSNVGRGMEFARPIAFCGGVAANRGVVRAFERVLGLEAGELIVPDEHAVTGAIGAALASWFEDPTCRETELNGLDALRAHLQGTADTDERLAPLRLPPGGVRMVSPAGAEPEPSVDGRVPAYLGVDVGSISTNVVVMDEAHRVLAKAYLMTAGRPIEAVREGLSRVGAEVGDRVTIRGAGTTGSGRYLTGDIIGADIVVNEITAQATAAAAIDPTVDTIFEIGGQDSKYISLRDGVVVDFEMNHACAAGTGSFLEEQAEKLGIAIKGEFGRLALESERPVRLGERCTVFMESDLQSYMQKGADKKDLVAGLCCSIVLNYLNRVVGKRRIGERIFFQGGTAFNRGVVAAFEQVTEKPIFVPEHHEVTGAIGMAILAKRHVEARESDTASSFRGFDLADRHYEVESFECEHCANNCEIKKVTFEGQTPIFYGSRCDRYNVRKDDDAIKDIPNLFRERQRMLEEHLARGDAGESRGVVGIPLALSNYQLLPFWSVLFKELGYTPIASGRSTKQVIHRGVELVTAQTCFPVKVAHGHVTELVDRDVDFVWLPSVVAMPEEGCGTNNYLCPYVQTIPYLVKGAVDLNGSATRLLSPPVRFQEGPAALARDLQAGLCGALGVSRAEVKRAVPKALAAQDAFEEACRRRGREVLESLPEGRRAVVVVSRPYNGCDRGINLDLPGKLRKLGAAPIPMDFLDLRLDPKHPVWENMYWKYGQRILRAAQIIAANPRLDAVYLTNFSCGPDSFIVTFFKRVLGERPCLVLEIDEHSADAGVVTRLEAFLDSLKHAQVGGNGRGNGRLLPPQPIDRRRTLYVPNMCDSAVAMAAAFRRAGQPSEVLPPSDERSLELGRQVCSGKECLPCIVTAGDMLRQLDENGVDQDRVAFFMPAGDGPCRFGQYNCLHRLILDERGYGDVPVISPNQGASFYRDFLAFQRDPTRDAWTGVVAIDLLQKVLFRVRPYEHQPGQAERIYQSLLAEVGQRIEQGRNLLPLMERAARRLAAVPRDTSRRRPVIGIVGEIYVRTHEFSNNQVVRRLEALGAEVSLASFGEWIYYTNLTRDVAARRERAPREWLRNRLKDFFQHKIERRLARPLEAEFGPLCEPPIQHVVDLAEPFIHPSFEGEAILSIGKTLEFFHDGASGVVNVMPFTCMPSTVVASQMKRLRSVIGNFPILNVSYDGQRESATQTRLEALMHQVRQYDAARAAAHV